MACAVPLAASVTRRWGGLCDRVRSGAGEAAAMRLVNLLPWRYMLAQRRRRFWAAMMLGTLVAMLAVRGCRMASGALDSRRQTVLAESDRARREWLARALEQAGLRLRQREARQRENQLRYVRRSRILAWRDAMMTLAVLLPDEAWLTRLEVDEDQWRISGLARTPAALNALEHALDRHSNFRQTRLRALIRKGAGEWQFIWQFGLRNDAAIP
ncbi:hypothetical protein GIX45_01415 [Erwinia sp. CPCC 100877]|nr:hypothetical protein [Erwinia sp. CPCC 100877]